MRNALISFAIMLLLSITLVGQVMAADFTPFEQELVDKYETAFQRAANYALNEMRPTVDYAASKILRIKADEILEGGSVKARVHVDWKDAVIGDPYYMIMDIWLTDGDDGIYLTRYKKKDDNNLMPIMFSTDERCRIRVVRFEEPAQKKDDF